MVRRKFQLHKGVGRLSSRLMERHPYELRSHHRRGKDQENFLKQKKIMSQYILMNIAHETIDTASRQNLLKLSKTMLQNEKREYDRMFTEKELELIHTIGKKKFQKIFKRILDMGKSYTIAKTIDQHTAVWAMADIGGMIQRILFVFEPPRHRPLK